jgi:hypothetical protein
MFDRNPWAQAHGYHRCLAPRDEEKTSKRGLENGYKLNVFSRDRRFRQAFGTCPGTMNVFTHSLSPQTVMPGNRLNHLPEKSS